MGHHDVSYGGFRKPAAGGRILNRVVGIHGSHNLVERSLDLVHSLVSRCLNGDEAAWEELVRSTPGRSTDSATVHGSGAEAQDLTQEVFLRVFRTLKTFRSAEGSFGTWLARVARNLLIDHYRRTVRNA